MSEDQYTDGRTHTFAELEVSDSAHDEIKEKLEAADYYRAFVDEVIYMQGIGLIKAPRPRSVDIFINMEPFTVPYGEGFLTYEEIREMAYPGIGDRNLTCVWSKGSDGSAGILSKGQRLKLVRGLHVSIVDTSNA